MGSERRSYYRTSEPPKPVGGFLGGLFEKLGIAERVERARIASRWEEVVGPRIAERTGDVRVSGRVLLVDVCSAAWLTELDMMRHRLLKELNAGAERGTIEKIVFLQADGPEDDESGGSERRG